MSDFSKAIPVILAHEGGEKFTVTKGDKGGATKWGITLATLRLWRGRPTSTLNVRNLTREEAEKIYRARYWDACRCGEILDQDVATKIFDVAVNCGPWTSIRIVQGACVSLSGSGPDGCPIDGVMGPITIGAVNACDKGALLSAICELQRMHYEAIISRDPTQAKFRNGWLKRAEWRGEGT